MVLFARARPREGRSGPIVRIPVTATATAKSGVLDVERKRKMPAGALGGWEFFYTKLELLLAAHIGRR